MARLKKAAPDSVETPVPKSKKKIGPTDSKTLATAIEQLEAITGKLRAMAAIIKELGVTEVIMEGPKLLPRGVNSLRNYANKLNTALDNRNKM